MTNESNSGNSATGCGRESVVENALGAARNGNGKPHRVVVKIGTSTLIDDDGMLRVGYLFEVARQVHDLRKQGIDAVIVSSGAIGVGLRRLGMGSRRPSDIPTLQAAAAIGQVELSSKYSEALAHYDLKMAQVLITRYETGGRESYLHARDTMERLLELGIVPLINENDTVVVDEIKFGDNDTLATLVATMIKADLVILLSDIEGLYTADPRTSEDAELLEHVGALTEELYNAAGGSGSAYGSGGMITKIKAARVLMAAGIPMVICEGSKPNVIADVASGKQIGTIFDSDSAPHANARKLWIALGGNPRGSVTIDAGAANALRECGSSLLPVGIREVEGSFGSGDAIGIYDESHMLVGRGLARLSNEQIARAMGKNSQALAADPELADLKDKVAVHRDEMVVF